MRGFGPQYGVLTVMGAQQGVGSKVQVLANLQGWLESVMSCE